MEEILSSERDIAFAAPALEVSINEVEDIFWVHVSFEPGLIANVLWTRSEGGKRAVGFTLSDGMDVPEELSAFKFARQKSKLAGTIRGSCFEIKSEHPLPPEE